MSKLGLTITTKSPVMLSAGPPAHNLLETLDFIPGNTIRGILAKRYLEKDHKSAPEDENFRKLFLSGKVKFGFATIDGALHIPLSARTCKYQSGFKKEGGHGVMDLVISGEKNTKCPDATCSFPHDYFEGFWDPKKCQKKEVNKRTIIRTAIDLTRGSASIGQLYSNKVIEEDETFIATIEAPDDLVKILEEILAEPFIAGIGKGRSRGQGWVEVCKTEPPLYNWGTVQERRKRFSGARFHDLAVTLLSDAIFTDNYLRDCTAPSIEDIASLGIGPGQWEKKPYSGFSAVRTVFGFDGEPFRLPRIPRVVLKAGSVFLFKRIANDPPTLNISTGDGIGWIGENSREGFGLAILWHPFHIKPEAQL